MYVCEFEQMLGAQEFYQPKSMKFLYVYVCVCMYMRVLHEYRVMRPAWTPRPAA